MAKLDDLECRRLVAARNYDALIRLVAPHVVRVHRSRRSMAYVLHPAEVELAAQVGVWKAATWFDPTGAATFFRFAIQRTRDVIRDRRLSTPPMAVSLPAELTASARRKAQAGEPCPSNISPQAWAMAADGIPPGRRWDEEMDRTARAHEETDSSIRLAGMWRRLDAALERRFPARPHQWRVIADWLVGGGSGSDLAAPLGCTPQNAGVVARQALSAVRSEFADFDIDPGWPKVHRRAELK